MFDLEKAEQCLEMGRRAGAAAIPDILAFAIIGIMIDLYFQIREQIKSF